MTGGPDAISVYHDEDGDYDFDMVDGYPVEGYGTSGARNAYDALDFRKASKSPGPVTIRMHYLN